MARISKREKRRQFGALIKLHKRLCKDYSDKQFFSIGQVKTAFNKAGLPHKFLAYAYSLYCAKSDFDGEFGLPTHADEYAHNRVDVCEMHFYGDSALAWTEGVTRDWPRTRRYPQKWNRLDCGTKAGRW